MTSQTTPDDTPASGYTISGAERILSLVGIVAGGFFIVICVDLLSGGRLSAPVRAAALAAIPEGPVTDDVAVD
jgi:hypothetical protein